MGLAQEQRSSGGQAGVPIGVDAGVDSNRRAGSSIAILRHKGAPLFIRRGITERQIEQLIIYSNSDAQIQRFTHDGKRFGSREAFDAWAEKGRTVYSLSDAKGNLSGIMWFGEKEMPTADYRFPVNPSDYPYTQAMRMYGKFRGEGLATQFADITNRDFADQVGESTGGVWIDPDGDNAKSLVTFSRANPGYVQVSPADANNRVVLVNRSLAAGSLPEIQPVEQSAYYPFPEIKRFSLETKSSGQVHRLIYNHETSGYCLEIKPDGFVPKSGLLLAKYLVGEVEGKRVLDVGTGETGFLAIHSAAHAAAEVVGTDIDKDAVLWAEYNGALNGLTNVSFKESNLFSGLESSDRFDIIVSNPPQMPMINGSAHDAGGTNGREIVEQIIRQAPRHLHAGGQLYMVLFDFLGIDKSYAEIPSLREVFNEAGFDMEIIGRAPRKIRRGGKTEDSLGHILSQYPGFAFTPERDSLAHEMFVVRAKLRSTDRQLRFSHTV